MHVVGKQNSQTKAAVCGQFYQVSRPILTLLTLFTLTYIDIFWLLALVFIMFCFVTDKLKPLENILKKRFSCSGEYYSIKYI